MKNPHVRSLAASVRAAMASFGLVVWTASSLAAEPQIDPANRSILFVRGADGSGGLGSGSTEHLSDINNSSTSGGNHGFGELAATLRADGFTVSQWIESNGQLDAARLQPHRAVVFGSNNRVYAQAEVDAFHAWVDAGGAALFMSDANWGPNWDAASASDNQFLGRYGLQVYQDSGGRPVLRRSDAGRYLAPSNPVLSGPDGIGGMDEVDAFEGEGVSFFEVGAALAGWTTVPLVDAAGFRVRLTTGDGTRGGTRSAGPNDAALVVTTRGNSSIIGHFDRNTFFNVGGVGSNITRFDNRALAINLARMLVSVPATTTVAGVSCALPGVGPSLDSDLPLLSRSFDVRVRTAPANAAAALLLAGGSPMPTPLPGGCVLQPDANALISLPVGSTDAAGALDRALAVPDALTQSGELFTVQAALLSTGGLALGVAELSNGLVWQLGYPR